MCGSIKLDGKTMMRIDPNAGLICLVRRIKILPERKAMEALGYAMYEREGTGWKLSVSKKKSA